MSRALPAVLLAVLLCGCSASRRGQGRQVTYEDGTTMNIGPNRGVPPVQPPYIPPSEELGYDKNQMLDWMAQQYPEAYQYFTTGYGFVPERAWDDYAAEWLDVSYVPALTESEIKAENEKRFREWLKESYPEAHDFHIHNLGRHPGWELDQYREYWMNLEDDLFD